MTEESYSKAVTSNHIKNLAGQLYSTASAHFADDLSKAKNEEILRSI